MIEASALDLCNRSDHVISVMIGPVRVLKARWRFGASLPAGKEVGRVRNITSRRHIRCECT